MVSTEDEEIAGVTRRLGVEVPFLRPARLAADETPMLDVLTDLVASLEQREQYRPDILVLLQPTSPFRRAGHIDAAIDLLRSSGADSVVTVVPVPHQFTPSSLMQLEGDRLVPWTDGPPGADVTSVARTLRVREASLKGSPHKSALERFEERSGSEGGSRTGTKGAIPTRRQDKPLLFARNGPAVLAVRTDVVTGAKALYGADTRGLVMSREDSFDIDDRFDLGVAELLMASRPA